MAALPSRLGKYIILDRIASGGMADIFLAKTVGIGGFQKLVALKRVLPKLRDEPRFVRNLINEARIAVSLNHRNIVQMFDFGRADNELFLAMELIDGHDLRAVCDRLRDNGRTLPLGVACSILSDVGAGLDYAHRKTDRLEQPLGIVHCDVSPQNIMLSRDGYVKLLDFGVGRAAFTVVSTERRVRGKPRYMAPEQARGEVPTAQADVFALGIVAWELFTSRALFGGKDVTAILASVRHASPPAVDSLNPAIPPDLSRAVSRALSTAPEGRGTAGEFARALAAHAATSMGASNRQEIGALVRSLFPREENATGYSRLPSDMNFLQAETVSKVTLVGEESALFAQPPADIADLSGVLSPHQGDTLFDRRRVVVAILVIDPEAHSELMARDLQALGTKHGAVVQTDSPGVATAFFGLEIAASDDVEAAIFFALDGVELADESHPPTQLRVAIQAGVWARRDGLDHAVRKNVIEATGRMAKRSQPGIPLLLNIDPQSVGGTFETRSHPARNDLGSHPRVIEVVGIKAASRGKRSPTRFPGSFIGRSQELQALRTSLTCDDQRFRTVVIYGEPGIGKTRLIEEVFSAQATVDPLRAPTRVQCRPAIRSNPYAALLEWTQELLDVPSSASKRGREHLLARFAEELRRTGISEAHLGDFVGAFARAVESASGVVSGAWIPSTDLLEQVVTAISALPPSLFSATVIIEAIEFADAASLRVLAEVFASPTSAVRRLVATSRGAPENTVGALYHPDRDTAIYLGPLQPHESIELAREHLPQGAPERTARVVASQAAGNPLFLRELARASSRQARGTPNTLKDLMLARTDDLPSPAKAVLQRAAIVGPVFHARLLRELLDFELNPQLMALEQAELIVRVSNDEFQFRHRITQEAIYESLAVRARQEVHAKIAEILLHRSEASAAEPPALVALHLEGAGKGGAIAQFWIDTGHRAALDNNTSLAQHAYATALERKEISLEDRLEALRGLERAEWYLAMSTSQRNRIDSLDLFLDRDDPERNTLKLRRARLLLREGDLDGAQALVDAINDMVTASGPGAQVSEMVRLSADIRILRGDYEKALVQLQQALLQSDDDNAKIEVQLDSGFAQLRCGRHDDVLALLQRLPLEAIPEIDLGLAARHLRLFAATHLITGKLLEATLAAGRSVELAEASGDRFSTAQSRAVRARVQAHLGQFEEAGADFRGCLETATQSRAAYDLTQWQCETTLCLLEQGYIEEAHTELGAARARAVEISCPYLGAQVALASSVFFLTRQDPGDGERSFDAATQAVDLAYNHGLRGISPIALARQACALLPNQPNDAHRVARKAVNLLESQRYSEGRREEILWTHAKTLIATQDLRAADAVARLHQSIDDHERALPSQAWRDAYRAIPVVAEIRAAGR